MLVDIEGVVRASVAEGIRAALPSIVAAVVAAVGAPARPQGMSRVEYARTWGYSVATVDRRVKSGQLKSVRLGRSVRILVDQPPADDQVLALVREARR